MIAVRYAAIVILVLLAAILALVGILTVTRNAPIKQVVAEGDGGLPHVGDSLFARTMELYVGTHIHDGNTVEILLDGDGTYPPLWRDIASAQQSLTMQMYYCLLYTS